MTRPCSCLAAFLVSLFVVATVAFGQPVAAPGDDEVEAAARLRIYLVTMGPGAEVWEQFGHNAIQVVDPAGDLDVACNWGVFDFFETGFYKRFIFGRMLYRMEFAGGPETVAYYRDENRSVYRQELNLTPRQKAVLYQYIAWNSRPENRNYRYDYYRDNCSTRVRDLIDRAVAGGVRAELSARSAGVSYRWHTRRITAANLPLYTSLLYILGQPVDRPITEWEESFLPLELMAHLRTVRVMDDAGNPVPLIKSEEILFESTRPVERGGPPKWIVPFLAFGLFCSGVFFGLAWYSGRSRLARHVLVAMASLWSLFIGGAGTFALWGWMSTEHVAVYRNENLLHFFPPALLLTVLIPLAYRGHRRLVLPTLGLAAAVPVVSAIGLALKAHPAFRQVNFELIAWVLPTHVAFAHGVWRVVRAPAEQKNRAGGPDPI
jgi:hypothetical protein